MTTKAKFTIEQIEAAGFDSDTAQRVRALCAHLDCEPDDLSQGDSDTSFRYHRRKVKRGTSPDAASALVRQLADALARCPAPVLVARCELVDALIGLPRIIPGDTHRPVPLHVDGKPLALDVLRCFAYGDVSKQIETHAPDALKVGLHDVANALYFLSPDTDDKDGRTEHAKDHRDTLREAWRVMAGEAVTIADRRTTEEADSGEYNVLTDGEADDQWDASLESYLDDGCVEGADSPYFDRERWKKDARIDGRAHHLSGYDGNEDSETVTDDDGTEEEFFIYRTN